jgi:transcriptional regulator with XRE-family HTH domain
MRRKDTSSLAKSVDSRSCAFSVRANFATMTNNPQITSFTRPFPTNLEIGSRIRLARKRRGWTIADMAEAGKIKAVVIGSYERGSRNMPISRLGEIAAILDVDVMFLLGQPPTQTKTDDLPVIDLRAISRTTFEKIEWLTLLVTYCAGIAKNRGDWNGEVLSIRNTDLLNLSFAIGISQAELIHWLRDQNYLIKEINRP